MRKILSFIFAMVLGGAVTAATFSSGEVYAGCDDPFMGLRPWYSGLVEPKSTTSGSTCTIKNPTSDELPSFVWRIVLNISADISMLVGYVAIIFIIWGGFKYIMSTGEPGKVAMAKSIIMNALIGLVIALLATVIVNTIIAALGNAATT